MSDKLPEYIDPLLLAERRSVMSGSIELANLQRLAELLTTAAGTVDIDVAFAKQGKQATISGHIKATPAIKCQCCLQAIDWPVDLSFKLGVVTSTLEADRLSIDCEPLIFNGEKLLLTDLIEDEILLALPDYPKHEYDCITQHRSVTPDTDKQETPSNKHNPFSVLAKLKNTGE